MSDRLEQNTRTRGASVRRLTGVAVALLVVGAAGCSMLRVDVVGDAMAPTLNDGDSAIATRAFDELNRGDIIGFRYPRDATKSFVQRIIGLPGDAIEMRDGQVWIDGELLDEPYIAPANRSADTWGPMTLESEAYFVMGDNRRDSSDSRSWGSVRRAAIWAKVIDR